MCQIDNTQTLVKVLISQTIVKFKQTKINDFQCISLDKWVKSVDSREIETISHKIWVSITWQLVTLSAMRVCKYTGLFVNQESQILEDYVRHAPLSKGGEYHWQKTSDHKISRSLEDPRFVLRSVRSHWNLTGVLAALLPKRLSNFKRSGIYRSYSRIRDYERS